MSDSPTIGYAQAWRPTIWHRLGFGMAYVPPPDEDQERHLSEQGYCEGALVTDTFAHLDWKDRLRLLVSGRLMVHVRTQTDVMVRKSMSQSAVRVLPPGFKH
jgi:hypothetical protein